MRDFADSLDAAFLDDDGDSVTRHLLHRVQMEDGLALHIGREAVIAELLALSAAFDDRTVTRAEPINGACICLEWSGMLRHFPGHPQLTSPAPAKLRRHLWIEAEAGRALRITAITDWAGLAANAGIAHAELAAAFGAARPAHAPLGELASGRGQLAEAVVPAEVDPEAHYIGRLNARGFAGFEFARRERWLRLLARVPDARFTLDRSTGDSRRHAVLWRLQGHVAGRRVSLPGSSLLWADGTEAVMFDELALDATGHRPPLAL